MHFMGGLWLGLVFILIFWNQKLDSKLILKILLGVLLIGVLWEIFEIVLNYFTVKDLFNALDTFSDLCFDLAGGAFAIFYFLKKTMFQIKNRV